MCKNVRDQGRRETNTLNTGRGILQNPVIMNTSFFNHSPCSPQTALKLKVPLASVHLRMEVPGIQSQI